MNRAEHLLTCLSEECAEVSQRAAKALRFGLSEVQAGQGLTNAQRITDELKDLWAVAILCAQAGLIPYPQPSIAEIDRKREKIERFMAISRAEGVLSDG
ncbi:MAG: hypothetical protein ACK4K7_03125 [Allosphingosinicella sp.]|uniref:hypothetical protein n=1 Tax=Allosphingosinicella sp. TaxID=2823234 RepID=UPI0039465FCF